MADEISYLKINLFLLMNCTRNFMAITINEETRGHS